jgi:luciferase family oxidoreductase group 1
MIPLSVLDLATVGTGSTPAQALAETTSTAMEVERLGFRRLWVAEHHAMPAVASSAPPVLIAHLASATSTLRIGAGGVMLPNHSPLVVAEQFATLEALHPGRIDLGLGRAPGTDHVTARALRRSADLSANHFPNDVVELINYLVPGEGTPVHPAPVPGIGYAPEIWLLGSSTFSAQLAAMLGLPFSFAYHFAPTLLDEALDSYRSTFRPSNFLAEPHAMIADEALWLSGSSALSIVRMRTGRRGLLPSPEEAAAYEFTPDEVTIATEAMESHLVGNPTEVQGGLHQLVQRTDVNEIMLSTRVHSLDARIKSLSLVAKAWELEPSASAPPRHS